MCTILEKLFFDEVNIQEVQMQIIDEIRTKTGITVPKQRRESVIVMMTYAFKDHSMNLPCELDKQVRELNKICVDIICKNMMVQIEQQIKYLNEVEYSATTGKRLLDYPEHTTKKNQLENNSLSENLFISREEISKDHLL